MKIAAAYIRVSTNDQMEYSPDSQLRCIQDYAQTNGYLLKQEYIFREDDGVSGRGAKNRTQFQRMIAMARYQPRPFDCILLWKFSRFARSRADSVLYKTMLRRLGIDVISVSEPLVGDKTSILVEALIEAMDEYYSINLAEEVRRGMREKVTRGEPVTTPPFGYRMKEKRFVPDPDEAAVVKMMYSDCKNGIVPSEIAEKLNAMGLHTRRGGQWESRAVRYILNNPVYHGALRWNPNGALGRQPTADKTLLTNGNHQPLVSKELWDAVQQRLKPGTTHRRGAPACMLRGLIFCSNCGCPLIPSSSGSMQCSGYSHGACKISHCISMRKLDAMVITMLENDLQTTVLKIPPPSAKQEQSALLQHCLKKEHRRLARLWEAYLNGAESLEDYTQERNKIERTCRSIESELKQFCGAAQEPSPRQWNLIDILRGDNFTAEQKNILLRSLIQKIIFDRRNNCIRLYYR